MAPNKKIEEYMNAIMTNMLRLCKMKVPCVITFHHQGKSQQFGTRFARQHLVKYKSDLRRALAVFSKPAKVKGYSQKIRQI